MFIAFGVLMPLGALVARFFKDATQAWFALHRGLQVAGVVSALAGFALIVYSTQHGGSPHFANTHSRLGLAAVCAVVVQGVVGALRPAKSATGRPAWFGLHAFLGWGTLVVAAAAIVLGLRRYRAGKTIEYAFYGYAGVLVACVVALVLGRARRKASSNITVISYYGGGGGGDPLLE